MMALQLSVYTQWTWRTVESITAQLQAMVTVSVSLQFLQVRKEDAVPSVFVLLVCICYIVVADAPVIIIQPLDTVVPYGSTVLLTCVAISNQYREDILTNIYWERDSELFVPSNSTNSASVEIYHEFLNGSETYATWSILELCNMTFEDEGVYSCTANDSVGSTAAYFNLSVYTNGKSLYAGCIFMLCAWLCIFLMSPYAFYQLYLSVLFVYEYIVSIIYMHTQFQ